MKSVAFTAALAFGVLALLPSRASVAEQATTSSHVTEAPIDPAAMNALTRMGAYLRTLENFEITSQTTAEDVLDDGQKLQFDGTLLYRVRRPDAFYIETRTDRRQRQIYYDGRTITVFAPGRGYYAQVPAPSTIRELLQTLDDRYGISLPLSDLFYWGTPDFDVSDITSAAAIGYAKVDGQDSDQYAFREGDIDWQIWIKRGDQPLPVKIAITTRHEESSPEFTARLTWNVQPTFSATTFTFTPPQGVNRIQIAANAAH
ncbi:MAG: DUF2092 domain-containing protein [Pseudomonadota bacterium]